jgi:lipopolysaccharide/colanic/teichoic acid biosynthesis glycosyltransferase
MSEPLKRSFDIVVAAAAMYSLTPLLVLLAIAVRLDSPGPALYRGTRVGRYGREFQAYKFRSMRVDASMIGPGLTASGDTRITRVGRILRLSKLDELPQLWNVLRGEMSLVGPRPEDPRYVALYNEKQRHVLSVRPGITGPTQLRFRHEERMLAVGDPERLYREVLLPAKLESDQRYIDNCSFHGDIGILALTLVRVAGVRAEW